MFKVDVLEDVLTYFHSEKQQADRCSHFCIQSYIFVVTTAMTVDITEGKHRLKGRNEKG